jgi:site-specific DNA recombinase
MKRFAFYGRVSTEDQQDPTSSRNWQLARSRQIIEPAGGEIVAEFFDIAQSRSLPWKRRPEAARLLETFRDPDRGFDAVVIGEPQRAFYGNQFGLTFPVFTHFDVGLWVPEVGGAVDPGSEAHDLVMSLYGGMSKGERMRIKTRVRSAMASQAAIEGRFLGGRPPYGYQLVDAGPHPNPSKAAIGQQLRRLAPDPIAAPVVQRIYDQFCSGDGLHTIASALNADGIPSPSGHDPERNKHRASGQGKWAKSAIRAILANPRYTGFEVWNKQRKDEVLLDVEDVALGHQTKMRWNDTDAWIWSQRPMHQAIVSTQQFETAQATFAGNKRRAPRQPAEGRHYLLSGLLHCGVCGRRMQGQWNHGRAYYRCKFPSDYPDGGCEHPQSVYVKEAAVIPGLDGWLASLFEDEHIDDTAQVLSGVSEPDPASEQRQAGLRDGIKECDRKIERYRSLLDQEGDVAIAAKWITDTQRERRALEAQLGQQIPGGTMTTEQVKALVAALRDIVDVLADADPADKAELYNELGVTLRYDPEGMVTVQAHPRGVTVCVGGGTHPAEPHALFALPSTSWPREARDAVPLLGNDSLPTYPPQSRRWSPDSSLPPGSPCAGGSGSALLRSPDTIAEEAVGHRPGRAGGSLLRARRTGPGPSGVDGVAEDLEPPIEQLRSERVFVVQVAVDLDCVDLVARGVEKDMAPVVGDRSDVGLPVDEAGSEGEVGLEEVVLDDVGVLAGDHFEDLVGGVQVSSSVRPRR